MSINLSEQQRAAALCYVAYCGQCGKIYGAAVQIKGREKDTAKFIEPWIKAGDRLNTITAAEVRAADWCKCAQRAGTSGQRETENVPEPKSD